MKKHRRRIYAPVALLVIAASVLLLSSHRFVSANYDQPVGYDLSSYQLTDGTYTGVATGFRPGLTVEVVVRGGSVTSVEVVSHAEVGRQYWSRPIAYIPDEIVAQQNTDVDSVSGATATSKGIMAAVENALQQAMR